MGLIRTILSVIINLVDLLFAPRLKQLPEAQRAKLQAATQGLSIYQFKACPFCVKLRWEMRKLGIDLPFKDAKNDPRSKEELLNGGGKVQVPCLRTDGPKGSTWLYESKDIASHLSRLVDSCA